MSVGVNNVGGYYPTNNYGQSKAAQQTNKSSFLDALSADKTTSTSPSTEKTRENMSMEEYKQYIHSKISQIPINPSLSGWNHNIVISEEGFEAMKNDSEYEAWVLDAIKSNFSVTSPFNTSPNAFQFFGATKEEAHGYVEGSSSKASKSSTRDSEDSFWQKRAERHREYMERSQELQMEHARLQAKLLGSAQKNGIASIDKAIASYDANIFSGL